MKKLLLLTAFMLMYLCSYSQNLYVRNASSYDITVGAIFEFTATPGSCSDGSGNILVLNSGDTQYIPGAGLIEWTVARAGIIGFTPPVQQVVSNSTCSNSCFSEVALLLKASWNGCYEVTFEDN